MGLVSCLANFRHTWRDVHCHSGAGADAAAVAFARKRQVVLCTERPVEKVAGDQDLQTTTKRRVFEGAHVLGNDDLRNGLGAEGMATLRRFLPGPEQQRRILHT